MKKSTSNIEETLADFDFSLISNEIEEMNNQIRDVTGTFDTKALIGASAMTETFKGIANVFEDNRYNIAVAMASINYLEDTTSLENFDGTDEYKGNLEILVELYTTLILYLQQVWNVITTDKAKDIMAVAGFILTVVGFIITVKGVFNTDTEDHTPEIHINNYSDNVEIETKTEENQVEIFIQDRDIKKDSTTGDKLLSCGDRT